MKEYAKYFNLPKGKQSVRDYIRGKKSAKIWDENFCAVIIYMNIPNNDNEKRAQKNQMFSDADMQCIRNGENKYIDSDIIKT